MRVELLVVAMGLAMQLPGQHLGPSAVVAALDEQLQLRFRDTTLGFGISRLCGTNVHGALAQAKQPLRQFPQPGNPVWRNEGCGTKDWALFRPRNPQEQWVDGEIKRARLEIWTLLVGGVRRTLEGPVVAGVAAPGGLNEVRGQLLPRIAKSPIPEETLGSWQVVVKPVRATHESCIGCHTDTGKPTYGPPRIKNLKLGDPLGYLVYLYR